MTLFGRKRLAVEEVRQHLKQAQTGLSQRLQSLRAEGRANVPTWEAQLDVRRPPDEWDDAELDAWWAAYALRKKQREGK